MGLFKPKWMKDTNAAEEVVRFSVEYNDLDTLYRMALKCPFPEYRYKAIRGLKECACYDETMEHLQKLISEGVTAHDRCLAAALFGDKKVQQTVCRIRELAAADPALEKRFTDAAVQELSDDLEYADRLAGYYQISAPEAIWRYAGSTFIQKLLTVMNRNEGEPKARISPMKAADCLGEIYRTVGESRAVLSPHRGKTHSVHYDYPSPYCGEEHDDFMKTVDTKW